MKKCCALLLILAALCTLATPALAADPPEVSPQYTYAHIVAVHLRIESGKASVTVVCVPQDPKIPSSAVTYLEKKVNGKWTRFAIPQRYNQWTIGPQTYGINVEYTAPAPSEGEYRAVAVFTLTGDTTETITRSCNFTYTK